MNAPVITKSTIKSGDYAAMPERLEALAAALPDGKAFTFLADQSAPDLRTYSQVSRRAKSDAAFLRSRLQPGDRAILLFPPGVAFIEAFIACLYAEVVAVPVYFPQNRDTDWEKLARIAADCGAAALLSLGPVKAGTEEQRASLPPLAGLPVYAMDALPASASGGDIMSIDPSSTAFLQYTSGSTGHPKGVIVTHRNMLHNLEVIATRLELSGESVGASWLPPYHDMGLIGGILVPLFVGFHVVHMSPLSFLQNPLSWLQVLSDYRVTVTAAPNFAYEFCLQRIPPEAIATLDLSAWRVVCNGAEPINPATLDAFTEVMAPVGFNPATYLCCYGMAECTLFVSGQSVTSEPTVLSLDRAALGENLALPGTSEGLSVVGCGAAGKDLEVLIVDPQTGEPLDDGLVGEVYVSGPSVARGYWGDAELSREVFGLSVGGLSGCLRTGDLGFMHRSELFITGRLKDLIIINGRNLYPQDLEAMVVQADESLAPGSAACFSVQERGQEQLVVTVSVRRTHRNKVDAEAVSRRIGAVLAREVGVTPVHCVLLQPATALKTSSGKIRRRDTKEAFLRDELRSIGHWKAGDSQSSVPRLDVGRDELLVLQPAQRKRCLQQALIAMAAVRTGRARADIDPDVSIFDLGLDSLAVVELTGSIAASLDITLDPTVLLENANLTALVDHILICLDDIEEVGVTAGRAQAASANNSALVRAQ